MYAVKPNNRVIYIIHEAMMWLKFLQMINGNILSLLFKKQKILGT